jgi:integrase
MADHNDPRMVLRYIAGTLTGPLSAETAVRGSEVRDVHPDRVLTGEKAKAAFRDRLLRGAFGPEAPPEEVHLRVVAFAGAAAPNTLRALLADLRIADDYQSKRNRPALPVAPTDLYLLVHERAQRGAAKSSIARLVASLVRLHQLAGYPSPVDENVRWKLKEIRKQDTRAPRQALGLRLKGETADIHRDEPQPLSLLRLLDSIPADPAGLRDRAIISMGYDAGLRRSELVRVRIQDIERLSNGEASLFILKSKTDQEGEGARVWLSRRSVAHLDAWLAVCGIEEGYVFRPLSYRVGRDEHLYPGAVSKILKARMTAFLQKLVTEGVLTEEQAVMVIANTSAHSFRVGCDQDLFAAGVDIGAIMQGLRWTSPKQPLAYARHLAPATSKLASIMRKIEPVRGA